MQNQTNADSANTTALMSTLPASREQIMESDVALLVTVFPEIGESSRRLELLSSSLRYEFIRTLAVERSFRDPTPLASRFEDAYLTSRFGANSSGRRYAEKLLALGAKTTLRAFVRSTELVGDEIDPHELILAIEKAFPVEVAAWNPPKVDSIHNIIESCVSVGGTSDQLEPEGALRRVRDSAVGIGYLRYFRQFPLIHQLAIATWRIAYPIYAKRLRPWLHRTRSASEWLQLVPMTYYRAKNRLEVLPIYPPETVQGYVIKVSAPPAEAKARSSMPETQFPAISVACLSDCTVNGGSNIVFSGTSAIHHDLYDFDLDYTAEEMHSRALIRIRDKRVRWIVRDQKPLDLEEAATFLDSCAGNYAHWLTEVLPRLVVFVNEESLRHVPLLLDADLHANIYESVSLAVGTHRQIFLINRTRAVRVKRLHLVSVTGYVPFDRRNHHSKLGSQGQFSPSALKAVRSLRAGVLAHKVTSTNWPQRVFVRRTSGSRRLLNSESLELIALDHGFTVVEPEKLSFALQILIFSNASLIIGPTGAGLANIVFCSETAKLGVLIADHPDMAYGYWSAIGSPLGVEVTCLFGKVVGSPKLGVHSDFHVSEETLTSYLQDTLPSQN
jgi:capsular polysaccharide biosynthesis protein